MFENMCECGCIYVCIFIFMICIFPSFAKFIGEIHGISLLFLFQISCQDERVFRYLLAYLVFV